MDLIERHEPSAEQSDGRRLLRFLRQNWVLILSVTLAVGALTLTASLLQEKQYRASATLLYDAGTVGVEGNPEREVGTLARLALSEQVLQNVRSEYGYETLEDLREDLLVTSSPETDLITVTASASSADGAADLANDVAGSLIDWRADRERALEEGRIASLESQLQALAGQTTPSAVAVASDLRTQISEAQARLDIASSDLAVVSDAVDPDSPSAPKPARNTAIGLLVGLLLGLLAALARSQLDRRVHSISEVEQLYGVPALGVIPHTTVARRDPTGLLADFESASPLADAFRTVRANLALYGLGTEHKVIAVTSAVAGEGKSTVSANLAMALAASGRRVLAISADLRSPALHRYFTTVRVLPSTRWRSGDQEPRVLTSHAAGGAGLVEVLAGEATLGDAFPVPSPDGGALHVLASGRTFVDPAMLIDSKGMSELLATARREYEAIVIDCPPLLATAEASILARDAEVVVVAAWLGLLTRKQARDAAARLVAAGARTVGAVVSGELDRDERPYGYGAVYGSDERARDAVEPESDTAAPAQRRTRGA